MTFKRLCLSKKQKMNKKEKIESVVVPREKKVKRVKTQHVRTNATTISPVTVDCFLLEEKESVALDAKECFEAFKSTSNKLKDLFTDIYTIKQSKAPDADIRKLKFDVGMHVMGLKKLNRLDKHCCKRSRDIVNECKLKVDTLNLQYENLLYEETHLQKEITKCLEFRSKDEDIDLVSVDEFFSDAPEEITCPKITMHDNHELTLARLQWELEQRKRLALQLKEAEVKRGEIEQSIQKLKERYDSIAPTLHSVQKAAEPLHAILGLPLQITQNKHKAANFLPRPLYVLYVEACAYAEALDKKINVRIEGNIDEAKILNMKIIDVVEDSGESDTEENVVSKKRHSHFATAKPRNCNEEILKKHPLSICLTVVGEGGNIALEFFFLHNLKIVTVCIVSISPQQTPSVFVGQLLKTSKFLNCLYPDDHGLESPNPANVYQLKDLDYEVTPFSNEKTGWPYNWVQHISGLHFIDRLASEKEQFQSTKEKASYMEATLGAIRSRLESRLRLSHQMNSFEQGVKIPPELSGICSANVTAQLKKWAVIPWAEILAHPSYSELIDLGIISKDSFLYKAVIERGSACLTALVVIASDYPTKHPLFLLFLNWKLDTTSRTNDALRELEEEINVHCVESLPEEYSHYVLVCQMHHILACFDIYLETEHSGESLEGPNEFLQEKVVTRLYRGRNHGRPYKYISSRRIFTYQ